MHAIVVVNHALSVAVVVLKMGTHIVKCRPAVVYLSAIVTRAWVATQLPRDLVVAIESFCQADIAITDKAFYVWVVIVAAGLRYAPMRSE